MLELALADVMAGISTPKSVLRWVIYYKVGLLLNEAQFLLNLDRLPAKDCNELLWDVIFSGKMG